MTKYSDMSMNEVIEHMALLIEHDSGNFAAYIRDVRELAIETDDEIKVAIADAILKVIAEAHHDAH